MKPAPRSARAPIPAAEPDTDDDIVAPSRAAPMEHDLGPDELEFIAALDRFKKKHGRPFPTWSEVLTVLRELGYRKV